LPIWLIPFGLLAYHTPFFWEGEETQENLDFNFEGAHRGGTPQGKDPQWQEGLKWPRRERGRKIPTGTRDWSHLKISFPFPFPFLSLFPSFHSFFCFVRPLHGLKRGYVTDGFLLYVTPWGHYGLFGCLASPSGDACIYPIILLYFSKRTQLYLRVSPRIDSVRFTLVLVSSPCKVKALQLSLS